jgi:hypothetical protein
LGDLEKSLFVLADRLREFLIDDDKRDKHKLSVGSFFAMEESARECLVRVMDCSKVATVINS